MSAKRAKELEDAVVEAVSVLDEADGSRVGMSEAFDSARSILETAYGDSLNEDIQIYLDSDSSDEDDEGISDDND